jgi:Protein of unknown function (DUF1631)
VATFSSSSLSSAALARQARELFLGKSVEILQSIAQSLRLRTAALLDKSGNAREAQEHRDTWVAYQKSEGVWTSAVANAWKKAMLPQAASPRQGADSRTFELMGDDVVENKILSSRLSLRILDKASWEFNDLSLRIRQLENLADIDKQDMLRPEVCAQVVVDCWLASGMTREAWLSLQDVIHQAFGERMVEAYHSANAFLVSKGVMAEIDLRPLVKRTPGTVSSNSGLDSLPTERAELHEFMPSGQELKNGSRAAIGRASAGVAPSGAVSGGYGGTGGASQPGTLTTQRASTNAAGNSSGFGGGGGNYSDSSGQTGSGGVSRPNGLVSQRAGMGGSGAGAIGGGSASQPGGLGSQRGVTRASGSGSGSGSGGSGGGSSFGGSSSVGNSSGNVGGRATSSNSGTPDGVNRPTTAGTQRAGRAAVAKYAEASHEETRMMTSSTPLARAKMRAQGVIGQLKRMLTDKVAGFDDTRSYAPSPQLAAAMAPRSVGYMRTQHEGAATGANASTGSRGVAFSGFSEGMRPEQAAVALRDETSALKRAAATTTEKATIEIVALMFQSILAEERIPPVVRVWFARLQMPVLRLALSEPEFFGSLQHPARRLIDRLGSCVLGFESDVSAAALETEIKRVVQVIEQYPETGRRVFQLVYDEFQKFIAKYLTEGAATQRVVSVAQQMEQKETAAIQYTIELRKMLDNMQVRDEIREFFFKVWAEVLALAAVKLGPQHADTINLKQVAADLVWAASAKPNRSDRAKVIQDLPQLLKRMRSGMAMLGFDATKQDEHIKIISDTLADAFMSKAEAVDAQAIEAMSKRLKNLEDFVSDDDVGDLPLDADSIELMLGIDVSGIDIITAGGSEPTEGMRAWAMELEVGTWFNLDHNGKPTRVQYAWRSDRGQLCLFANTSGRTYLFQVRRLAAYLQAGLIAPFEDETLTVRATRDALTKLDANPERLLG